MNTTATTASHDPAFVQRYGPWALVCGASEGTGQEFASHAAAKGLNVMLVARRQDKLDSLAQDIQRTHGVQTRTLSLDLASEGAAAQLQAAVADLDLGLVVFNAGGDSVGGPFLDKPYSAWRQLTLRNIDFLTEACHDFSTRLVQRGRGGLVLVGSEAALGGCGRVALYTATKAFALNLGESLWKELQPKGVDVLNVLIGATDTPKLRTVFAKFGLSPDAVALTPSNAVAELGLSKLGQGPTVVLNFQDADDNPLVSARIRRERVEHQSAFLDHFYGKS